MGWKFRNNIKIYERGIALKYMISDSNYKEKEDHQGFNFTPKMKAKLRTFLCLDVPSPAFNFSNFTAEEIQTIF